MRYINGLFTYLLIPQSPEDNKLIRRSPLGPYKLTNGTDSKIIQNPTSLARRLYELVPVVSHTIV